MTVQPHVFLDGEIYRLQRAGGISTLFDRVTPRVAARGARVTFLTPPGAQIPPPAGPGVSPTDVLPGSLRRRARAKARVLDLLARRPARSDAAGWGRVMDRAPGALFHSTYYNAPWGARTPSVCTVFDCTHERFPELQAGPRSEEVRALKRAAATSAARVLAISETTKRDVVDFYGVDPAKVDVTPLAADETVFTPAPTAEDAAVNAEAGGAPYLLFVGSRGGYKNFDAFAAAWARSDLAADFALTVAGPPLTPAEHARLAELGAADRVRAVPFPPAERLAALYRGAAAFVYPSRFEGFGLPPLEAMRCGTPVAASTGGSVPEVVGAAAELFDPDEPEALIRAVRRALDPARSAELRAAGSARAAAFSWDNTAELTLAAYRRALEETE